MNSGQREANTGLASPPTRASDWSVEARAVREAGESGAPSSSPVQDLHQAVVAYVASSQQLRDQLNFQVRVISIAIAGAVLAALAFMWLALR